MLVPISSILVDGRTQVNESSLAKMMASIKQKGQERALLVDDNGNSTYTLIDGMVRREALIRLGETHAHVFFPPGPHKIWPKPISPTPVVDAQAVDPNRRRQSYVA